MGLDSLKERLLLPKPKLNKGPRHLCSLSSATTPAKLHYGLITDQMGIETVVGYWSLGGQPNGTASLIPGLPPGFGGTSAGLQPQRLDFFKEMKLSRLVMDETANKLLLCFCSNKSCHHILNPPMHVSLKCIFCYTVTQETLVRELSASSWLLFCL